MKKPKESGRLTGWISWQSIKAANEVLRQRKAEAALKYAAQKLAEEKADR